jgi:hypothetical protein
MATGKNFCLEDRSKLITFYDLVLNLLAENELFADIVIWEGSVLSLGRG